MIHLSLLFRDNRPPRRAREGIFRGLKLCPRWDGAGGYMVDSDMAAASHWLGNN